MILNKLIKPLNTSIALLLASTVSQAATQPKFSITPVTPVAVEVPVNSNVVVQYRVTNNTKITRVLTMVPMQGITPIAVGTGVCGNPFVLASGESCLLTLLLDGSTLPASTSTGPVVCKTNGPLDPSPDPFLCSQAGKSDQLHITVSSPPITPSPVPTVGAAGILDLILPLGYVSLTDGANWLLSLLPGILSELNSVSCDTSSTLCVSVGNTTLGIELPLSMVSANGGAAWGLGGVLSLPGGANAALLDGVNCDASGSICVAVGNAIFAGLATPVTYTTPDGGASWNAAVLPSLPPPVGTTGSLLDIDCSNSGSICIAVGSTTILGVETPLTFTSLNSGSSWSFPILPALPDGASSGKISSVHCDTAGAICVAVGNATIAGVQTPLMYTSNNAGSFWTLSVLPNVPTNSNGTALNGVSCNSANNLCVAVGNSLVAGVQIPVVYTSNDGGATWGAPILPLLPNGGTVNVLNDVRCDDFGVCVTVGSTTVLGISLPLTYNSPNYGQSWGFPVLPALSIGTAFGYLNGVA